MRIVGSRNEVRFMKNMKGIRTQKGKDGVKGKTARGVAKDGIFSFFTGVWFLDLGFMNDGIKAMMPNEIVVYAHEGALKA